MLVPSSPLVPGTLVPGDPPSSDPAHPLQRGSSGWTRSCRETPVSPVARIRISISKQMASGVRGAGPLGRFIGGVIPDLYAARGKLVSRQSWTGVPWSRIGKTRARKVDARPAGAVRPKIVTKLGMHRSSNNRLTHLRSHDVPGFPTRYRSPNWLFPGRRSEHYDCKMHVLSAGVVAALSRHFLRDSGHLGCLSNAYLSQTGLKRFPQDWRRPMT